MYKVATFFDLDYGRLPVNPLILGLTLDLSQHLNQHLNLVADAQCTRSAQKEAPSRGADELASLQHHLESHGASILRSELVRSSVQDTRQGLQAVVQEIDLVEPLLQQGATLV